MSRTPTLARARSLVTALSVVAVAAVAALALAGCTAVAPSSSAAPQPTAKPASAQPAAGQCWNASMADAGAWSEWEGAAATSCSKSHTLYTFGVVKLSGLASTSWATSATNPALSAAISTKAGSACAASYAKFLPAATWNQQLINNFFFVPTRAQWQSGARWVRCDLGVIGYGTTVAKEKLSDLPSSISTLVKAVSSDPARYGYCINTADSTSTGPLSDAEGVVTDCRDDPQWTLATHGTLPGGATAAYPSSSKLKTEVDAICEQGLSKGDTYSAYYPSASDWKSGTRDVECWVAATQSAPVGGGTNV
jgi:Septum formation